MSDLFDRLQTAIGDVYRLEAELGGGGMSRVFLAEEVELKRRVVIKVLPPEMAAGVNEERFRREIQLAASLQHPHVVPLLTAGSTGDLLFYVMPYIEGESLRAKLARAGELPVGEVVRTLREVIDALAYAHRSGVVHRDIKPDNILLSQNHAVVTDFGVAKAVAASAASGGSSLTSLGMALGTPAYMAPEQAAADPQTDHRADIYAVGAVAYEMLTGRPPFTASTPQMVMAAQVSQVPDPVTRHRPAVAEALNFLVMRCLEKRAADRWQSADELMPHLEAIVTPSGGMTPTGAVPAATPGMDTALRRSHPARVAALFAGASLGVVGVVYMLMMVLGLPDWVLPVAIGLLAIGLPIVMITGRAERKRIVARTIAVTTPVPDGGVHGWLSWRRALLGGGLAFGGLALAVAAYMAMRLIGIGPVGTLVASGVMEERERIILADFDNRTDDSTLGQTVTELFRIDLAQSPTVTVLEPSQVARVLERMERDPMTLVTAELANEVAQREGFKAVVTGEVLPVGSGFVVSARLVSATSGDVLAASREQAPNPDEIVMAVDRLSASLRERIGESLRTIRANPPLERVTTGSTEALMKYAQANRANNQAEYDRAIALLEEAVALDPTFAMAYRKLGVILSNQGEDRERWEAALSMAVEYENRLTERERYLAQGTYYQLARQDDQSASAAYRTLLEKYPTDAAGLNNLANIYSDSRRWAEAEELHMRSITAGNDAAVTYTNAMSSQAAQGKFDAAEATLAAFADRYPEHPSIAQYESALASSRGDYEAAEESLRALRVAQRGNLQWRAATGFGLGSIARVRGKLAEAMRLESDARSAQHERGVVEWPLPLWEALVQAGDDLWYRSDTRSALARLDGALERHPISALPAEERPYIWLTILYARAGRPDEAKRLLAEQDAALDEEALRNREEGKRLAQGVIALFDGRPEEAVADIRWVQEESGCPICNLWELGEAYDSTGRRDSTIAIYERHLETPWLFRMGLDEGERPAILRRLGELYEERGERDRAADYYSQFVDLWQEADPELQPVVEDVRGRIARLVGERSGG